MPSPDQPLLSVIIVAYKSRDEIAACLGSLPQTLDGRAVEVVVVDNSPHDGAGEIIRERFPHVRHVAAEANLGFGRANNLGFAQTRGAFVLFLNPDTVCNEAALLRCLLRLGADPSIGLISPKLVRPDGAMDLACRRSIPTLWDGFCRASGLAAVFPKAAWFAGYNLTHLAENGSYDVGAINGAFMMARRAVLEELAEPAPPAVFDERFFMYGDDLDLCIRASRQGYRVVYEGAVNIVHVKGVSVAKDYERMATAIFDANRDVYLKHFNPRGSRWVRWKYAFAFALWKRVALLRARLDSRRVVRPV